MQSPLIIHLGSRSQRWSHLPADQLDCRQVSEVEHLEEDLVSAEPRAKATIAEAIATIQTGPSAD